MKDPVLTCIRDHPSELRHSPNFSLSDLEEAHMQERGHMQNDKVYLSYVSFILDDNFCHLYFVMVFNFNEQMHFSIGYFTHCFAFSRGDEKFYFIIIKKN